VSIAQAQDQYEHRNFQAALASLNACPKEALEK
jgi:hypothetical protein